MDKMYEKIESLLVKDCYVVDVLPETVSSDSIKQYLEVEYYLLNTAKHCAIKDKFVNVILKLMCYYRASALWNGWIEEPKPEVIDQAVEEIMENHSGTLNVLFPDENTLIVFEWDCLNLSVYNPSAHLKVLLEQIARSEGLFVRKTENET